MMTNNSSSSIFNHQPKASLYVWSTVFIVISFLIFVLNFATIITFVINRHLRRRSVYCLINLAVADMLYGVCRIIQQSLSIGRYLGQTYDSRAWTVINLCGQLVFLASLFCLVLVSLERVYATFFPFRHRTTQDRMYVLLIIITWILPLLPTLTSFFLPPHRSFQLITSVSYLFCLIIICISYTAILVKVKKQPKRLQLNEQQTALQTAQKREQHLAMTLFIVTVLSLITWLPLILFLASNIWYNISNSSSVYLTVRRSVWLIQISNSLINPIIYVFRMKDFRKALTKLTIKCSRKRHRIHPIVIHHDNQIPGTSCLKADKVNNGLELVEVGN